MKMVQGAGVRNILTGVEFTNLDVLTSKNNVLDNSNIEYDNSLLFNTLKKVLNKRELYVLIHSFGLFGNAIDSLDKIAEDLEVVSERVQSKRDLAIAKLQTELKGFNKMDFINPLSYR